MDMGSRLGWRATYSQHVTNDGGGMVKSPVADNRNEAVNRKPRGQARPMQGVGIPGGF